MKRLLVLSLALCLVAGVVAARADQVSLTLTPKLSDDSLGSIWIDIFLGTDRLFVTTLELNPNAGNPQSNLPKRGFFLPLAGGSRCYEGPPTTNRGIVELLGVGRETFVICADLKVSKKAIGFEIRTTKTTRFAGGSMTGGAPTIHVEDDLAAGTISLNSNKCTVRLTRFDESNSVDGHVLSGKVLHMRSANSPGCFVVSRGTF